MSLRRSPLILLAMALSLGTATAEEGIVHLRNGAVIQGEILARKADRLIVDLDFDVISIPMDAVLRVDEVGVDASSGAAIVDTEELFWASTDRETLSVERNLERCGEAVVEVRTPTALGSGFIIHPTGYVVTNDHVIVGEQKISVTVFRQNGRELEKVQFRDVEIVGTNPAADLALLKLDPGDAELLSVPLGDSDQVRQGQRVFAIGSPLGLERTVSQGIVSLRNRAIGGRLFIQNTTEINPGNSGGPLFNLRGEVVGVNDLKIAGTGLEGLGFSIAVNALKEFLRNLDAFAFDARNPNSGFRYLDPPRTGNGKREDR